MSTLDTPKLCLARNNSIPDPSQSKVGTVLFTRENRQYLLVGHFYDSSTKIGMLCREIDSGDPTSLEWAVKITGYGEKRLRDNWRRSRDGSSMHWLLEYVGAQGVPEPKRWVEYETAAAIATRDWSRRIQENHALARKLHRIHPVPPTIKEIIKIGSSRSKPQI